MKGIKESCSSFLYCWISCFRWTFSYIPSLQTSRKMESFSLHCAELVYLPTITLKCYYVIIYISAYMKLKR